jgi:SAM-dependent methyltransferase
VNSLRSQAIVAGWLCEAEPLLVPRLAYPVPDAQAFGLHGKNRSARDAVVSGMIDGLFPPERSPSYFGAEPEVTVGESDRYGIPFRTVLGTTTGLLRADPYYSDSFLQWLWTQHYRALYQVPGLTHGRFLADQIRRAEPILERVADRLGPRSAVLDVGCGMGGMLLPFRFHGCRVIGCDYGQEYADRGRSMGIDIRAGGPEAAASDGPFDLVLLSHVLQHVADPVAFLTSIAALLKPDGLCYVEVPGLMNLAQWYGGDLLRYLQNANRWHFTADTLRATLRRAGLAAPECDERITCYASPAPVDANATPMAGPTVMAELERLERAIGATGG